MATFCGPFSEITKMAMDTNNTRQGLTFNKKNFSKVRSAIETKYVAVNKLLQVKFPLKSVPATGPFPNKPPK